MIVLVVLMTTTKTTSMVLLLKPTFWSRLFVTYVVLLSHYYLSREHFRMKELWQVWVIFRMGQVVWTEISENGGSRRKILLFRIKIIIFNISVRQIITPRVGKFVKIKTSKVHSMKDQGLSSTYLPLLWLFLFCYLLQTK